MKVAQNIARNLSNWMKSNSNLDTLEKVSEKSGVGFGTVRRSKNGDGNPTLESLEAIASVFGRPIEDLLAAPKGYTVNEPSTPYQVETISPEKLQNEVVKMLSQMDIDDQNVWIATIIAASNKARRKLEDERIRVTDHKGPDPNQDKRHA